MSLEEAMRKWRGRGEMPSFDAIVEKAFHDGYVAGRLDEKEDWARIQFKLDSVATGTSISDAKP